MKWLRLIDPGIGFRPARSLFLCLDSGVACAIESKYVSASCRSTFLFLSAFNRSTSATYRSYSDWRVCGRALEL